MCKILFPSLRQLAKPFLHPQSEVKVTPLAWYKWCHLTPCYVATVRSVNEILISCTVVGRQIQPKGMFVGCLTSQQHASVSQGRICSDNCTCCHTEIEVADQTFHLTQSQYTDIGPTSPSTDTITPGAWRGSHCTGVSIFMSLV